MIDSPFSLNDKTFLVTGATSGIGLETCKQIGFSGGRFFALGRNLNKISSLIVENNFVDSFALPFDLSNLNTSEIEDVVNSIPQIDGFVYCAGIVKNNPIQFFDDKLYNEIRNVNLDACLFFLSFLLKKKKFKKPASVVFVSSISGIFGMKGNGLYAITKSALNIMAKTYANELSSKQIRVNSVAPGMVNTKITEEANDFLSEEVIAADKKKYPLGYGNPEDVALPIVFLLSSASKWVTGQVLILDGGRTAII
jgi:NAD(P)-dependent dehydrogenase (short-subunit alcohol dehydrogenase family)